MEGDWGRLADYLRDEMDQRDWTQKDFAQAANVGTQMIYQLLSGHHFKRMPYKLPRIERAVGWPPGTARRILEGQDLDKPAATDEREREMVELLHRLEQLPPRFRHRVYMRVLREWLEFQEQQDLRDEE